MASVKIENLTYIYNQKTRYEKKALDNVNFEIKAGESIGIMGRAGSGKSTLITLLKGLRKPTSRGYIYW